MVGLSPVCVFSVFNSDTFCRDKKGPSVLCHEYLGFDNFVQFFNLDYNSVFLTPVTTNSRESLSFAEMRLGFSDIN